MGGRQLQHVASLLYSHIIFNNLDTHNSPPRPWPWLQHHNKPLVCSDPPEPESEHAAANYSARSARSEMKKTLRRCAITYLVLANFSCNLTSVKRGSNKDPCFVRCRSSFSCQNYPFKKVRWRRVQLLQKISF